MKHITDKQGLGLQWQLVIFNFSPEVRHVQPAAISIRDCGKDDEHIRCPDAIPALVVGLNLRRSLNTFEKCSGQRGNLFWPGNCFVLFCF